MLVVISMGLEYFRCQRNHLHVHGTQFTCDGAEDTTSAELARVVEQYASVVVKADVRAVSATDFLLRANNQRLGYGTLLNVAGRDHALDRYNDHVTNRSVATLRTAEYANAEGFTSTTVIADGQSRFCLDHVYLALSTISTTLQRFVLLRGRVSMMSTVSPTLQSFFSS